MHPDVVHFDNTFPLVSPGAYSVVRKTGIPVVQTLHNYRLLCPSATFFRDGHVCEDCLGKTVAWSGIRHGCYRGSKSGSATVAALFAGHRMLGTWSKMVDVYVTLTQFARRKFIEAGMPGDKILNR